MGSRKLLVRESLNAIQQSKMFCKRAMRDTSHNSDFHAYSLVLQLIWAKQEGVEDEELVTRVATNLPKFG